MGGAHIAARGIRPGGPAGNPLNSVSRSVQRLRDAGPKGGMAGDASLLEPEVLRKEIGVRVLRRSRGKSHGGSVYNLIVPNERGELLAKCGLDDAHLFRCHARMVGDPPSRHGHRLTVLYPEPVGTRGHVGFQILHDGLERRAGIFRRFFLGSRGAPIRGQRGWFTRGGCQDKSDA